eukprot:COSAG02_NODE_3985_length_5949_cov_7.533846_3_plen_94_part_00
MNNIRFGRNHDLNICYQEVITGRREALRSAQSALRHDGTWWHPSAGAHSSRLGYGLGLVSYHVCVRLYYFERAPTHLKGKARCELDSEAEFGA